MTCFRLTTALAAALATCALATTPLSAHAQRLEVRRPPPEAPASYRAPNLVRPEPAAVPDAEPAPEPAAIDPAERFRDSFFGGLLGYGVLAGLGALFGMIDAAGNDTQQPILVALLAPVGLATGVWIGGLVHGGSRYDGAILGTLIGGLLSIAMIGALGGPSLEDPATISIGILTPLIGAIAGAEIATAASGVRF